MATRIWTAVLTIPIFLTVIYSGGIYLKIALAVLTLIGLYEFSRLYQQQAFWDYLAPAGLSLLYLAYNGLYSSFLWVWFVLQLIYLLIRATFTTHRPLSQMWHMVAVFYIVGLFSFLWLVNVEYGFLWTLFGIAITWATDTGAYFTGLSLGRSKMAPKISPHKTWEGAIGGALAAALAASGFARYLEPPLIALLLLGVCLSIAGQMGDLVESAIKRERAVKDSGKILPGHGGILDRFDSLLFVLPLLYLFLKYLTNWF